MTVLCGLDIATRSGISVMDGDKVIFAEAFRPKGETSAEIFHGFRVHLRSILKSHMVDHVAAEQPLRTDGLKRKKEDGTEAPMIQMATIYRLYGLAAAAEEICFALNIPFVFVNMMTWRKAFLGNARADKQMAVDQCKLLGFGNFPKDAAEATGVAWWLAGHLRLSQRMRPGEFQFGDKVA